MSAHSEQPPVILLAGPTASGKTDLAVELVRHLPCAIISVDSAMVYRGMDIGTAKPAPEILSEAPHRLIDIVDPSDPYSAARFLADASREISEIRSAGRLPLLVGGTMLYFRALVNGLSELPPADPAVRARLRALAEDEGLASLHRRLHQVDPEAAARIHPNDPQRLQRALEVYELTGRPWSELIRSPGKGSGRYRSIDLGLVPADRSRLHGVIEQRFRAMLEGGLVDEVAALRSRGDLDRSLPSVRSVGYRQVWGYLDGEFDRRTMVERGIFATRQLAKRQFTWLRNWPGLNRIDAYGSNRTQMALKIIAKALI